MAAAAGGDSRAWDALVERYARLVWSVARAHGLGPADAADVSQTTWLRLVEHLSTLRDPERVGSWLATTARHESRRVLRAATRELSSESPGDPRGDAEAPPHLSPEGVILTAERRALVAAAFAELPPPCHSLLRVLLATPPPSYAEVSSALGVPVGSIGPRRARCLEHLRRVLASRDIASRPVREAPRG